MLLTQLWRRVDEKTITSSPLAVGGELAVGLPHLEPQLVRLLLCRQLGRICLLHLQNADMYCSKVQLQARSTNASRKPLAIPRQCGGATEKCEIFDLYFRCRTHLALERGDNGLERGGAVCLFLAAAKPSCVLMLQSKTYLALQRGDGGLKLGGTVGLPVPLVLRSQLLDAVVKLFCLQRESVPNQQTDHMQSSTASHRHSFSPSCCNRMETSGIQLISVSSTLRQGCRLSCTPGMLQLQHAAGPRSLHADSQGKCNCCACSVKRSTASVKRSTARSQSVLSCPHPVLLFASSMGSQGG